LKNHSDELITVAKRVVWFKPPDESLNDTKLFLAHVMTYGTLEDIVVAMRYYTDADFESVLTDPPAGVFDVRSWSYWNLRYHHEPVPPLPMRVLPETNFTAV
jgi:hypothetical protein